MKIDKKIIKELSDYLNEFNLTELEYTEKDTKIKVSKNNISVSNQSLPSNIPQDKILENKEKNIQEKTGIKITSPIIGTAYHAPEPGAKKFIEVGKKIKKGDTICLIEAMKTFNEIKSDRDCTIKTVMVKNGEAVEFGQPLFEIS